LLRADGATPELKKELPKVELTKEQPKVEALTKEQPNVDHPQPQKAVPLLQGEASNVWTYSQMGFHTKTVNGTEVIDEVKLGTPASEQGLQSGDQIVTVKQESPTQAYIEFHRDNHLYRATITTGSQASGIELRFRSALKNGSAGLSSGVADAAQHPDIYKAIAQSGQTIVNQTVVNVQAYCPCTSSDPGSGRTTADPWTAANITIQPGQRLWLDTDPGAQWDWTTGSSCDVNGIGYDCGGNSLLFRQSPSIPASSCALIAWVGSQQPPGSTPGQIVWNATTYSDPAAFAVGNYKTDYSPQGSGQIYFMPNDNAPGDNSGSIRVRVIVTKTGK